MLKKIFPILQWLPNYRKDHFQGDLFAGITVGIMLIPQGMAYALIAGLPPVYGLYASLVPQLIYALLGTSRQLSVAPVAMDSLLVAAGVSVLATEGTEAYLAYAILLAFLMGMFQMILGISRLGFITNLLSKPVISGFTSAAAIIIGLNQLKYLVGYDVLKSNRVYEIIWSVLTQLGKTHMLTLLIGLAGILIIVGLRKINKRIPGSLIAVIFGVSTAYFMQLQDAGVSIVRSIPEGLPSLLLPNFDMGMITEVFPLALTISVVAFMEAYSVAKAIESQKKDYKVSANQELIALGSANLIGSFFQSFPVTGGFSRSAVNFESGANTPAASVISAVLVGLTLLLLTPLFYYLPHAILASVIMVAVAGLIDIKYIRQLWHDSKLEFLLLLATFLVTLNFSMIPGIVTGIVLSILLLLYKSAYPHIAVLGRVVGHHEFRNIKRFDNLEVWPNMLMLRVDAPLTFINIQFFKEYVEELVNTAPKDLEAVVVDAGPVSHLDATAVQGLKDLIEWLSEHKINLVFCDVIGPVRDILHQSGLIDVIKKENIFLDLNGAVKAIQDNSPGKYQDYALQSNYHE